MANQDQLIALFRKYLNDQCSPTEVAELLTYFDIEDDQKVLKDLISEQLEKPVDDKSQEPGHHTFDKIFSAISNQIDLQQQDTHIIPLRFKYWLGIAASLLLISGISLYLYNNKQLPSSYNTKRKPVQADVAPGSNKAILTLADGSIISLDETRKGQLAKQHNSVVNKLSDGEVIYKADPLHSSSGQAEFNTITTPRGGQYAVVLPDGSRVWLNAASSIKFPVEFTGDERNVELTGEAYFEIAKNKHKPFKLTVNGARIEVLGTHFNVMAYDEEATIRTTLLEGSVKVSKNNNSSLLEPGQRADIDKSDHIKVREADTEQAMAWKNGYFKFNKDNIQTIMRQLSRWYDIDIVYEGRIPDDEFMGKIRRSVNVSEVLKVLELNNVHFKIINKKIIVTNN